MVAQHLYLVFQRFQEQAVIVGVISSGERILQLHWVIPSSVAVAGYPEILHPKQAILITSVIKFWPFRYATTPYPDQVQVHISMITYLCIIPLFGETEHFIR